MCPAHVRHLKICPVPAPTCPHSPAHSPPAANCFTLRDSGCSGEYDHWLVCQIPQKKKKKKCHKLIFSRFKHSLHQDQDRLKTFTHSPGRLLEAPLQSCRSCCELQECSLCVLSSSPVLEWAFQCRGCLNCPHSCQLPQEQTESANWTWAELSVVYQCPPYLGLAQKEKAGQQKNKHRSQS